MRESKWMVVAFMVVCLAVGICLVAAAFNLPRTAAEEVACNPRRKAWWPYRLIRTPDRTIFVVARF